MVTASGPTRPLPQGKQLTIMDESAVGAGVTERTFAIDADTAIFSLWVDATAGDVTAEVYTGDAGREILVATFPTVTAPSTELLIKRAAQTMGNIRCRVTYTGACSFTLKAKGVGTGAASIKVLGAETATATQITVPSGAPTLLIPASLTDRQGLILRNWSDSDVLYYGFSAAEATTGNGYPISHGEQMGMDLSAGVEVWGVSDGGPIDVRIAQAGG